MTSKSIRYGSSARKERMNLDHSSSVQKASLFDDWLRSLIGLRAFFARMAASYGMISRSAARSIIPRKVRRILFFQLGLMPSMPKTCLLNEERDSGERASFILSTGPK